MRRVSKNEFNWFVDYCWMFYGTGQMYSLGASRSAVRAACRAVTHRKDIPFDGDTLDRESVCLLLESLGYSEISPVHHKTHLLKKDAALAAIATL
mgnify:FL=1